MNARRSTHPSQIDMKYPTLLSLAAIALIGTAIAAEPARQKAIGAKPLTYKNVVSFFKDARLRPTEVQRRCTVFFEGEWKDTNNYNYCLIIVENSDEDVQVTFYLTDAHEMIWVTEFLDSPFFAPAESKELFGLINSRHDVQRGTVGRYRVDFHSWEPRHARILVFSFTRR